MISRMDLLIKYASQIRWKISFRIISGVKARVLQNLLPYFQPPDDQELEHLQVKGLLLSVG